MTRAIRQVAGTMFLAVLPCLALAQDVPPPTSPAPTSSPPAPSAQDKQEARPTGLPAKIAWTFNFDAGWGSFGFANSLFTQPQGTGRR
jgi:hypothetical protein